MQPFPLIKRTGATLSKAQTSLQQLAEQQRGLEKENQQLHTELAKLETTQQSQQQ